MTARGDSPLWITFRGAGAGLAVVWSAWIGAAVGLAAMAAGDFAAAVAAVFFLLGVPLARRLPEPTACLRRFHLDDGELVVLGPGRRVRRLAWGAVESVEREGCALAVRGGRRVRIPLEALRRAGAWTPLLLRVVPQVAQRLWARLERGPVRLRAAVVPAAGPVVWWGVLPMAGAAVAGAPPRTWALLAGIVVVERVVSWLAASGRGIRLEWRGLALGAPRGDVVPWHELAVVHGTHGMGIAPRRGEPRVVPETLRDYWAAAAVIELRARLGADAPAEVYFRARVDGGALAVVGEVEALP